MLGKQFAVEGLYIFFRDYQRLFPRTWKLSMLRWGICGARFRANETALMYFEVITSSQELLV